MGGLLLPPRPAEAPNAGTVPASPSPAPTAPSTRLPDDLSPRVKDTKRTAGGNPSPSPGAAEPGPPDDLALPDFFPVMAAAEAPVPPEAPASTGPAPADPTPDGPTPAGEALGDDVGGPGGQGPFIAGLVVSLAILSAGGGFLWWRNRDSRYWPA